MLGYVFEFWWMFPVAFCVCLMAAGTSVEGAVFSAPIFLLAFPLFAGVRIIPIEAVCLALSIEIFGFGSALLGCLRRNPVDAAIARGGWPSRRRWRLVSASSPTACPRGSSWG